MVISSPPNLLTTRLCITDPDTLAAPQIEINHLWSSCQLHRFKFTAYCSFFFFNASIYWVRVLSRDVPDEGGARPATATGFQHLGLTGHDFLGSMFIEGHSSEASAAGNVNDQRWTLMRKKIGMSWTVILPQILLSTFLLQKRTPNDINLLNLHEGMIRKSTTEISNYWYINCKLSSDKWGDIGVNG